MSEQPNRPDKPRFRADWYRLKANTIADTLCCYWYAIKDGEKTLERGVLTCWRQSSPGGRSYVYRLAAMYDQLGVKEQTETTRRTVRDRKADPAPMPEKYVEAYLKARTDTLAIAVLAAEAGKGTSE